MIGLKVIIGVTGASGSVLGYRLLEKLQTLEQVETHLIMTRSAERTAWLEMGKRVSAFRELANHFHPVEEIGATLASGSFQTHGMVVAPCSIHSMSAIAHGITDNLLTRAADVVLKERRRLILMVREMPFHLGHLRSMTALAEMGAVIAPPIPGFYGNPQTAMDLVDHCVDRVIDLLGIPNPGAKRWDGNSSQ
ncbi:MAG: 3-octaprenyl-4-hydroxybenzoate carboxy-lyase [Acidobacteriia bacterium 12-62-4]|nr:MAG: 3-octaprenyl-4-hydroxybenzoate carboxy-lyase [Acidobacteriia bacterium 12-62-4]